MYIHVHIYEHGGQHRNRRLTVLSTTMLVDLNAQNERNKGRERRENKQTKIAKKSKCRRIVHTSELSGKQFSFVS